MLDDQEEVALPTPLEDAELPSWQYNHLKRNGINTIEQLLAMTEEEFLSIRNFAEGSLQKTRQALLAKGIIISTDAWPQKPDITA